MAASALPEPGTKYGPCATPCQHRDCAATRKTAAAPCGICGEAIGYDRAFYRGDDKQNDEGWSHAVCLEDAIDKQQAAARAAVSR